MFKWSYSVLTATAPPIYPLSCQSSRGPSSNAPVHLIGVTDLLTRHGAEQQRHHKINPGGLLWNRNNVLESTSWIRRHCHRCQGSQLSFLWTVLRRTCSLRHFKQFVHVQPRDIPQRASRNEFIGDFVPRSLTCIEAVAEVVEKLSRESPGSSQARLLVALNIASSQGVNRAIKCSKWYLKPSLSATDKAARA